MASLWDCGKHNRIPHHNLFLGIAHKVVYTVSMIHRALPLYPFRIRCILDSWRLCGEVERKPHDKENDCNR